jgi:hypothetical protein
MKTFTKLVVDQIWGSVREFLAREQGRRSSGATSAPEFPGLESLGVLLK